MHLRRKQAFTVYFPNVTVARQDFYSRKTIALGHETSDLRPQLIELLTHHLQAGSRLGRVQPQQELARLHPAAILHIDVGDNASGRMLDILDVRLHDEIAGHDDRSRERHERGPPSTEDPGNEENSKADAQLVFECPSNARLQAVIGPVRRRSAVAIENEGGARHQTVTALADQLCNRRVDLGWGR